MAILYTHKTEKTFKNEQRSKDVAAKKRPTTSGVGKINNYYEDIYIIESVDSISKDERGFPLTQYITNGRISRDGYTFTHFKHHHRVLRLISYSMSI